MTLRIADVHLLLLACLPLLAGCDHSAAPDASELGGSGETQSIIAGDPVDGGDPLAWSTVALQVDEGSDGPVFCSGSLVDVDLMVTAAHCIKRFFTGQQVVFGTNVNTSKTTRTVDRMLVPSDFKDGYTDSKIVPKNNHDIALVHFTGGLPAGYAPARLPTSALTFASQQGVTEYGYGDDWDPNDAPDANDLGDGILRRATGLKLTATLYATTEVKVLEPGKQLAASGDSGGPLYATFAGKTLLVGVDNWGDYDPTFEVYARIDAHLTWLRESATKSHGTPCEAPTAGSGRLCAPAK